MNAHVALRAAICVSSFAGAFMGSALNVALGSIAAEAGVSPQAATLLITLYVGSATVLLLPATALAGKLGLLRTYRLGLLIASLASLALLLMPARLLLLGALRVLQGAGNACIFCTAYALLSARLPKVERGVAFGLNSAAVYAGLTCAPGLGGLLVDALGWRALFAVAVAGFTLPLILARALREQQGNGEEAFRGWRLLLCAVALTLLLTGLGHILSITGQMQVLAGVVLLTLYLYMESRVPQALLPPQLLRERPLLSWALAASLCHYLATFALALLLALHLQQVQGLTARAAGLLLMTHPAVQCLLSPLAGRMATRLSPHLLVGTGMALYVLALGGLNFLTPDTRIVLVVLAQVVTGAGCALFSAPNALLVMAAVTPRHYALASALQALARNLGMAVSMAILTVLFFALIDAAPADPAYALELEGALTRAFALGVLCGLVGLWCCVAGARAARRQ